MAENREKVDDETQAYYAEELELLDVLNELWNNQSEQAATNYFGCYEKAAKSYFPNICEEEKIQISNVQDKAEQSIIYILEASERPDSVQPDINGQYPFKRLSGRLRPDAEDTGYPRNGITGRHAESTCTRHLSDVYGGISEREVRLPNQCRRKQTALPDCEKQSYTGEFQGFL